MPTLDIKFDASTAKRFPVYSKYSGQCQPQPAFLELDIRDGSLNADYSGEIGNAVPQSVWHNLVLRFSLAPETTADQIAEIIDNNKDLFQQILDGSDHVWNGSNWVGQFTCEAQEVIDNIRHNYLLEGAGSVSEGGLIDLAEWIEDNPFPSTDQTLEAFAQDIIDSDGENGHYFHEPYTDPDSLLSDLRDIWAGKLYAGYELPPAVAKHLIEHGTCDDSQWMEELREFASAKDPLTPDTENSPSLGQ